MIFERAGLRYFRDIRTCVVKTHWPKRIESIREMCNEKNQGQDSLAFLEAILRIFGSVF